MQWKCAFSALMLLVGRQEGHLERGADLHMAQLMLLPLTVSCSSKIQIGFIVVVPGSPGQRAIKLVCACVCIAVDSSCRSSFAELYR